MASFKSKKRREKGTDWREKARARQRFLAMESLEQRRLLSGTPTWVPTDPTNIFDTQSGPMANEGSTLINIYKEYESYLANGSQGTFSPVESGAIYFQGTSVEIDARGAGNGTTFVTALKALGMNVSQTLVQANDTMVEGFIPISSLLAASGAPLTSSGTVNYSTGVSKNQQVIGIQPTYKPTYYFIGKADNEGETALGANTARTSFNVTGAGVTVGVLSDTVNQYQGGIATSVASGDIPSASRVDIVQDGPAAGATDEGRAMIENIYDVAPGVNTAFATAGGGDLAFAANINALATSAHAQVEVDDVGYADEPDFQEGPIAQAIDNVVTNDGVSYFSAAGNAGNEGYQAPFSGVTANPLGSGSGEFYNFNTGAGAAQPTITFTIPNASQAQPVLLDVQWDAPWFTSNGVNTNVALDVWDSNGNNILNAAGNNNAVATQEPDQEIDFFAPGTYTMALQVTTAALPGVIRFEAFGQDDINFNFPTTNSPGVTHPTTSGHSANAVDGIGVGAVPWWGAPPYASQLTAATAAEGNTNESFSSQGPAELLFNTSGVRLASPSVLQEPTVSGTDGGNISFDLGGEAGAIDTTNVPPAAAGEPSTTTNLSQALPSFFGTSSAAPNVAAIAALMKQLDPAATPALIKQGLIASTTPLNGGKTGVYQADGGFGLVNASAALAFVNVPRVSSIVPGGGQTVTQAPTFLQVTFNQPINFATISAGNLAVFAPAGSSVIVGAPIPIGSATAPTVVDFPITITHAAGVVANGAYYDTVINLPTDSIATPTGKILQGALIDSFIVNDVIPPKITGVSYLGRTIKISFSEPIDPNTINTSDFQLVRSGNASGVLNTATQIILSNDPRVTLSYNAATNTVTMDLSALPQTLLPSDTYGLIVRSPSFSTTGQLLSAGVTDVVGNALDGDFDGVDFPTGNGVAGGTFGQIKVVTLTGPVFNFVQLAAASDSGIQSDNNTNAAQPTFTGQIGANFPGTAAGVLVLVEFAGITHKNTTTGQTEPAGTIDLGVGLNGRGFVGNFDAFAVTNASGQFTVTTPAGLPNGLNNVEFVAIGAADLNPLPGLATATSTQVRIDSTLPTMDTTGSHPNGASIPSGSNVNALTTLNLFITDPVLPSTLGSPFAVPTLLSVPALNPATADNISNYTLLLVDPNGKVALNGVNFDDESSFISSATFTSTTKRVFTSDPYTGTIALTFAPGLPSGTYLFIANENITDAAGNPLAGTPATPNTPSDFVLPFTLQAAPVFITNLQAISGTTSSLPRSYFEEQASIGQPNSDGTPAPPSQFNIDFSNPLQATDSSGNPINYTPDVWLVASANTPGGVSDGNFGTLGTSDDGTGYSLVPGTTVTLTSIPLPNGSMPTSPNQPGFDERLTLTLPANFTLPADYYRLYLPNNVNGTTGTDFRIHDIYNNQLDGEFLGDETAGGGFEDLLPNGQYRAGLSGDGVPGGGFATSYVVVPHGNVIFANPSYTAYSPFGGAGYPNGSPQAPFPVLAPEAIPNTINGGNLNAPINFGPNFNSAYDKSGDGAFEPSALYAAEVASLLGPVVVVAEPGQIFTNPATGASTQATFVLQAPATGNQGVNDGSVSIPAMTTLVFQPGSTLKLENASLFVQNQGSGLDVLGGSGTGQQVTFTSFADDSVGGDTNHDGTNTSARPGDWGGIVFRNFDQQDRASLFPGQITFSNTSTYSPTVVDRLQGPYTVVGGQVVYTDAVSGADDLMSMINFANVKFGGGSVPQGVGTGFSAITLDASRPTITNSSISFSGGSGTGVAGSFAGLSADVDSLRQDNLAAGPLLRRVVFNDNTLNGIYIQGEPDGIAEPTDAMTYPLNATNVGGAQNYVLDNPYPYLLTTPMVVGSVFEEETGGLQTSEPDRLYIQPGMMVKFEAGTGIEVKSIGITGRQPSLNVGVRTYINEWDSNPALSSILADGSPNPNFIANSTDNATVLFTSFFDDTATTSYTNPNTQVSTTIVAPLPINGNGGNDPFQPKPGSVPTQARWGGVQIDSPAVAVINNATFQYGGGTVNTPTGTTGRHALEFAGAQAVGTGIFGNQFTGNGTGTHVSITDNNFFFNLDVPMNINPDGLLSADPDEPLTSGEPFFHNNVMANNGINGLGVTGSNPGEQQDEVDDVNAVWPGTDLTYIVRATIAMGPRAGFVPPAPTNPAQPGAEPTATVTLTIQSTLPGTILADGTVVPKPGVPAIVKLSGAAPAASTGNTTEPTLLSEVNEGAGFVSGMDNGVDPSADPLIDIGVDSEMRFLGIGANQATGQQRVPVVLTSIHDDTYGTTVRGVTMNVAISGDTQAPAPGDGGNIIFGSHTMTTYNLNDPRQGNLIDNVDIKYMARVEQIGGGIIEAYDVTGTGTFNADVEPLVNEELGQPLQLPNVLTGQTATSFADEYNGPNALTISGSNISDMRDFGFWAHPGFLPIVVPMNYSGTIARGGEPFVQQATLSYLVNDTFSNITNNPAVEIDANNVVEPTSAGQPIPNATEAVLLNDTFYNNLIGIDTNNASVPGSQTQTPIPSSVGTYGAPNDGNIVSASDVLAMNDIFDGNLFSGISLQHGVWGTQAQYSLFNDNGTLTAPAGVATGNVAINGAAGFGGNNQPVIGDPDFVDAAAGNFNLGAGSAAINAARSELGPSIFGDMLFPAADQVLNAAGGTLNFIGRSNSFGDGGGAPSQLDFVFLPGSDLPNYVTAWVPVLPTSKFAIPGPATSGGTWDYASLTAIANGSSGTVQVPPGGGERDQNGVERYVDPTVPITGAGSKPYFDIGAFEYIQYFPPDVTGVTATFANAAPLTGTTTKSIYSVGGIAGTNVAPQSIQVTFNHQLDPTTINSSTIMLEASTDGTFNSNSPTTTFINLAGKLVFDPSTDTLTISLGASGLILGNAEYRLILVGTGSAELRDPQGNALDGENLDATGAQKVLPSGDGIPGGNFQTTFTIDTHPPGIVTGTFGLSPVSYSNSDFVNSGVTNQTLPTFSGTISDIFPPADPVEGDTVFIDISTLGNGVFNDINAGVGTTDANGNFSIQLTTPLPNSNYTVGSDGTLIANGKIDPLVTGVSEARVRVVDQSGNLSNTVTGTLQSFASQGALFNFIVDTKAPVVTAITPTVNAIAPVSGGEIPVTVTISKNIDPATLNANTILVTRSGGDGVFGNGNDVTMSIDPASIKLAYLKTGGQGPVQVSFNILSTAAAPIANDDYQITLKGTGATPITDIAGNPLGGGTDFVSSFLVFSPSLSHLIYVGPATDITDPTQKQGTAENPFPTIAAGLAAANVGDVVGVFPGVYTESDTLKSLVTLQSASLASTDSQILPGDPLSTIIRAPLSPTGSPTTTLTGTNLISAAGGAFNTVLSGFTVASPLVGDPAAGPINTNSYGLSLTNSNIIVKNDYFIDSGAGVWDVTSGAGASFPTFQNDVFAGNVSGLAMMATTSSPVSPLWVTNSDFVYNTYGLVINISTSTPLFGTIVNNIFWENRSLDGTTGFAIGETAPDRVFVFGNDFADNGPSLSSPADDTFGVATAGGFNPAILTTTGPDLWGNFVGEPAFVSPRDPRPAPGGDGPGIFFNDADFDLTNKSAAIDRGLAAYATATDILGRGRVSGASPFVSAWNTAVFGRTGPADVGAFEFDGTGGITSGITSFHVTSATLDSQATFKGVAQSASTFNTSGVFTTTTPTELIVTFSAPVNQASLKAVDLVITGSGNNNIKATSLFWIDSETVEFALTGGYNQSGGAVQIGLLPRTTSSSTGSRLVGFNDTVVLNQGSPSSPPIVVSPPPTSSPPTSPITPPPPPATHSPGSSPPPPTLF